MKSYALALACLISFIAHAGAAEHESRKGPRKTGEILFAWKPGASLAPGLLSHEKITDHVHVGHFKVPAGKQEEDVAADLRASGTVEFAEPNYLVPADAVPNDPKYGSMWHLPKVNAPAAWDILARGTVTVAVCDSGVEDTHPDLAANMLLPGYNTVNGTADSKPVNFHGTFVAGMVAGVGNNGIGISGIAWALKILPVRISNTSDGWAYYSDMSKCISYAGTRGARVVNLSYAGASSSAVDSAARDFRTKGGLMVMAGMNDGVDISASVPDYPSFLLVGATDSSDARASFSNWGKPIDLVAPGANVQSTTLNGAYTQGNGTSFATPMVAGALGLIFSVNPALTADQAEEILLSTAKDLGAVGDDAVFGRGRLDLAAALASANPKPAPSPSPSPTQSPVPSPVPSPKPSPSPCVCA